jgi:hypothetical protein
MTTNSQIAFCPQGKTVVIEASVSPPLGIQVPVYEKFSSKVAGQMRIVNTSENTVHLGYGPTEAIAQANAVEAFAGKPAPSIPLPSGSVEILRFSAGLFFSGAANSGSSTIYMTPGEGL